MQQLPLDRERHDRQSRLPGWDQAKLANASVIIVGMGALGNALAQALALAGVGRMLLCDMDLIEPSNLSRMPLFTEADLGRSKVQAAAEALRRLAPGIQIETRTQPLAFGIGLGEIKAADLTLGCLDSRQARLELTGRCSLVSAPWIDGATGQWSGEVRPWLDPDGPCFGCGLDDATRAQRDDRHSCRVDSEITPAAATAPLSLLVGAHMALLAVRYLMGLPVDGTLKLIDGQSGLASAVKQSRDPSCPYHFPLPEAELIPLSNRATVGELLELLGPAVLPLAWQPFQLEQKCRHCGFAEAREAPAVLSACPNCGTQLRSSSYLELDRASRKTALFSLGIAKSEILALRDGAEIRYVQLTP